MKKPSPQFLLVLALWGAGLLVAYGVVFSFYVAGLFGDGLSVPVETWQRTLESTVLLGTPLAAFLVLGALSWQARWRTGLVPWTAGAMGILLLARFDAEILRWLDFLWVAPLLFASWYYGRMRVEGD